MPAPFTPEQNPAKRRRAKAGLWCLGLVLILLLALAGYAMLNRTSLVGREPPGAHIGRPAAR